MAWATKSLTDELRSLNLLKRLGAEHHIASLQSFPPEQLEQLAEEIVFSCRVEGDYPLARRFRELASAHRAGTFRRQQRVPIREMRSIGERALAQYFDVPAETYANERVYTEHFGPITLATSILYSPSELRYFHELHHEEEGAVARFESVLSFWGLSGHTSWQAQNHDDAEEAFECMKVCISLFRDARPWEE